MALEPITRQEKIVAGQDLTPITRLEKFLKQFGGGGGSIPKPLTYDYMPEGYPSKGIETFTLMEEQEVPFVNQGIMWAEYNLVVSDIKPGDKITVIWDGGSYDVIVKDEGGGLLFGNLALLGIGEASDYPFLYSDARNDPNIWFTTDTSPSHTIKVMRQQVTITPMSTDFIPKNFNVVFSSGNSSSSPISCNVTYDELRGWIENGVPVFAIYKIEYDDGSVSSVTNIMKFLANADSLSVYYGSDAYFEYKSDGTISGGEA